MQFDNSGFPASWKLTLSHNEVGQLSDGAYMAAQGVPSAVTAVCEAAMTYVSLVDYIGGNNGVDIYGSGLAGFTCVLPRGVTFATVAKFVGYAALGQWSVQAQLLYSLGSWIVHGFGADRGSIRANEDDVGSEERAVMVGLPGGKVGFRFHTGYLCADHARNNEVWADRDALGPWETWTLTDHHDGTISLADDTGHYMCCENNKCLTATRTAIGPWEHFRLESQPDGTFALKSWKGEYVSAAP